MAEDLVSNAGMAAIAYRDALTAAQNTQNALLRQYGFTMPGAGGQYTVEGAQAAFDPNTLFNQATGGVDQARLSELAGRIQVGGTGLLSDIMRGGAAAEAEASFGARSAGIGGGGLAAQRRALAEAQTSGQLGQARQEFVSGIAQGLQPIGAAYSGLQQARIADRMADEAAAAARATIPSVSDPMFETDAPEGAEMVAQAGGQMASEGPQRAGTKMYEIVNGYRWMGKKKGWEPVSGTPRGKEGVKPKPKPKPAPKPAPRAPQPPPKPAPAPPKPAPKPAPAPKKKK